MTRRLWESRRGEYLNLLSEWGLTPTQISEVEQLILEREIARNKLRAKQGKVEFLSPEAKQIESELAKLNTDTDKKVASLIGASKQGELKLWEDSKHERKTVEKASALLANSTPLTREQEQAVLEALYQARNNTPGRLRSLQGPEFRESVLKKLETTLDKNQLGILDDVLKREQVFPK